MIRVKLVILLLLPTSLPSYESNGYKEKIFIGSHKMFEIPEDCKYLEVLSQQDLQ